MRKGDDLFLLMSTSGTTGLPKGVPVPLKALISFRTYMTDAVDLRPDDTFWNIADPGWAYGLYYAVTGPLMLGHATTLLRRPLHRREHLSDHQEPRDHQSRRLADGLSPADRAGPEPRRV